MTIPDPPSVRLQRGICSSKPKEVLGALADGADPDGRDSPELPPLSRAVFQRDETIVGILLDAGASSNFVDRNGWTPLSRAADGGNPEMCRLLAARGAAVDHPAAGGMTPLACAAYKGHEAVFLALLELGADPHRPANDGITPADLASQRPNLASRMAEHERTRLAAAAQVTPRRQRPGGPTI